jgi:acyl-CoA thioesterase superfamily protein
MVGDGYLPLAAAVGPWGPQTVSGMVIAGLVGHVAEQAAGDADFIGTRLTVDMIRMAVMGEINVSSRILREGRRLRLVDVLLEQDGKSVAHGRAVFARRSKVPAGLVWAETTAMPPLPIDGWPGNGGLAYAGIDGTPSEDFRVWSDTPGPKLVWFQLPHDLVEDVPITSFVRAASIADVANPLTNWGSDGLQYVNSDVTLQLARLPEGSAIGLVARDRHSEAGVSVGTSTMHDHRGPVGICTVTALASDVPMTPRRRAQQSGAGK